MNKNILIVDDSSFIRDLLKRELLNYGYKDIYEGTNGEEAVSLYEEIFPSIVIMDSNMPIMNGIEALGEIKKIDKNAKVLILSETNIKEEALNEGAIGFLQKPFQPAYIWRKIDEINKAEEDKLNAQEFEIKDIYDKNQHFNKDLAFDLEGINENEDNCNNNEPTFELEAINDESRCNSDLCLEMESFVNISKEDEEIKAFTEELITKDNSQDDEMIINNESLYKDKELIFEDIKDKKKKNNKKESYKISISPPRGEQYLLMEESLDERRKTRSILREDELILNKQTKENKKESEKKGFLKKIKNIKEEILKTIK